ncbi:MAG TPA: cation diffusion facilitator family transporter [Gemmatimonadaceae bacterium]|nr:cation diffusion facilitator family transporter [Gemmatimonadaceae bacterium]
MADKRSVTPETYHNSAVTGHDHAHHHHHDGDHKHADHAPVRSLRIAVVLTGTLMVVEVIGGLLSNSIALLADAGHMLTDVAALALSLFVAWFSVQPVTPRKTFGYLRWEILAAFVNGAALILISVWIVIEAFMRVRSPEPIAGGLMLTVAIAGLIVNLISARVLHPTSHANMNVRGAYLHVMGDLLASVGTVVAAIVIQFSGWLMADPLASLLTTALIMRGAWQLVRESVDILLEGTPGHIDLTDVRAQLEAIPGIESVHDLHVWSVTPRMVAMSAHAIVRDPRAQQHVLEHVHDAMALFGIGHITVQLEQSEMNERETHLHA